MRSMTGAIAWIALTPIHARAECEARPGKCAITRSVPLQPPSTWAAVGSPSSARSPASHSGWLR